MALFVGSLELYFTTLQCYCVQHIFKDAVRQFDCHLVYIAVC